MSKPLISVIMPAYNCGATIAEAIDSALAQDVPLEVIVVNDCSPEDLDGVMAAYENTPAVRYVKNEKNMGAAQSRNRGVRLAQGEYVAFLDSDDAWEKGKLTKQLAALKKSGAVLCCTARQLLTADGAPTGRVLPVKEEIPYRELLKHNSITCSSVVLRRDVAREFPMDHEDSHEDYIMWLRITEKYGSACGVNEPLVQYRLSNTGKSGSKLKSAKMTFKVYRYMGFGMGKSLACFCSYAFHGVKKYALSRFKRKH